MRSLRECVCISAAVVVLGCAADASVGPSVQSHGGPAVVTAVNAATSSLELLPGAARARAKVYCNGTTCYAAAFDFKDYRDEFGHARTLFTGYFQNLQGTYPPGGPTTPLPLQYFRFVFPGDNDPDGSYVDAMNGRLSFFAVGNVLAGLSNRLSHDGPVNPEWPGGNSDSFYANPDHGVVGCDVFYPPFYAFQTCPSQGFDGWARLDFELVRLARNVFGAKLYLRPPVRFDDFLFTFGGDYGGSCTIGGKQPGTCAELPYRSAMRE